MEHIPENRLVELGLHHGQGATAEEADHLARCSRCFNRLAEEQRLTEALERIQPEEPPDGFAHAATERFVRAVAEKRAQTRRARLSLAAAAAVVLLMSGISAVFVLWPSVPVAMVVAAARMVSIGMTVLVLLLRTPSLATLTVVSGTAMLLCCTGIVRALVVRRSRARKAAIQ